MNHIVVLLQKEWLELRTNRSLLLSLLLPPLLITTIALSAIYGVGQSPDDDITELGAVLADPSLEGMNAAELGQAVLGKQFGILFLIMPLFIPTVIAAYSIVGEKTQRTLEPLLAAPIHTWELLTAKALASLIPSVAVTGACAGIYSGAIVLIAVTTRVFIAIVSPAWILVMLLCAPLLCLIAIAASVAISSRVSDSRTAQQISGVVVVPILIIFFTQMSGVLVLSSVVTIGSAVVLVLIAVVAIWGAARLFQRETILTRWS